MDELKKVKEKIEQTDISPIVEEIGEVIEVKDGVCKVSGLDNVENFELVEFEPSASVKNNEKVLGLVLNLEDYEVGVVVLGRYNNIREGDVVKRTRTVLSIGVGEGMIGRVVDPLGRPLDGKGDIKTEMTLPLERMGPSVIDREPVRSPLHTGIVAVDTLIPIGRGQRELIMGDRGTGKTAIAIDAIINQKGEKNRPICVYVAIGQRKARVKRLIRTLEEKGAMAYSIVVAAFSDDPASFMYLSPYTGVTIGEYFRDKGGDALLVFDDLTKQAWAWREISLILRRPPGREAYPGDIFYLHSKLLERAARLSQAKGGGSLTALPIIETQAGDMSGYIPTNVISICDGQIFLDTPLFYRGQRPAIDIGRSVSRVGSQAQLRAIKKVSGTLKLDLAQFQELERFSEFTEELDPKTRQIIERGRRMRELLKQADQSPLRFEIVASLIYSGVKGHLDDMDVPKVVQFRNRLVEELTVSQQSILKSICDKEDIDEETALKLDEIIKEVKGR
ncbi:MAG: F0F1 ATP synthase subunit alpha [bacterium]